uniref:Apple domain-containing protein n=1 Tax=Plectus sambesii TaxID=2011161 RepID=A0A914X989_9BILA
MGINKAFLITQLRFFHRFSSPNCSPVLIALPTNLNTTATTTKKPVTCSTTPPPTTTIPNSWTIGGVNPRVRLSSVRGNYKRYPNVQDCASKCAQETNFTCRGFVSKGPGSDCVLHGEIDLPIVKQTGSRWFLVKLDGASGKMCFWTDDPKKINPTTISSQKEVTSADNQNGCRALCLIGKLQPDCIAYAFSTNPIYKPNNCYLFSVESIYYLTEAATGDFTLSRKSCQYS